MSQGSNQAGNLLVIGAGGHGKVVADCAEATGQWASIAFLDDRYPQLARVADWPVVGPSGHWREFDAGRYGVAVAIGDNKTRMRFLREVSEAGFQLPVLVHPAAWVSRKSVLGPGTVVFAQVAVNIGSEIGRGTILNTGCLVDHDCRVGEGTHISPGANLAGNVTVGAGSWIGIGASIRHGIAIGRDVIVGAGAAVVEHIPDSITVAGVPAKKLIG